MKFVKIENQNWVKDSDFTIKVLSTITQVSDYPHDGFEKRYNVVESDIGKYFESPVFPNTPDGYKLATQGLDSAGLAREWRDGELKSTDWIAPVTDHPQHSAYTAYRKKLRDWPSTSGFPATKPTKGY